MFCQKCGAVVPDDMQFCGKCGAQVQRPLEQPQGMQPHNVQGFQEAQPPKKKGKKLAIGISIAAVVVVVAGVVIFLAVNNFFRGDSGSSAESAEQPYMEPFEEFEELANDRVDNEAAYMNCFMPDILSDWVDAVYQGYSYGDETYSHMVEELQDIYGYDYKLMIRCSGATHASKETIEAQQEKLREAYAQMYQRALSGEDQQSAYRSDYESYQEHAQNLGEEAESKKAGTDKALESLKEACEITIVDAYKLDGVTFRVTGSEGTDSIIRVRDSFFMYQTEDGEWFCEWSDFRNEWYER